MPNNPAVSIEDRVRAVAYDLWVAEGQPEGRAEAHWLKAYELVNAEAGAAARPKRAAAKTATVPVKKAAAPRQRS
ncbi:MAG: DUF2934 domain-containing protein [Rhizobiales bacterium]|nr:DUF2934 domain-containing protein [Hyphomicrobiales bacterium]MBI3674262.1 DUF2934 domain-containing protein [Hyphomicrobiales bacterium]